MTEVAERLRAGLRAMRLAEGAARDIGVTASFGVTHYHPQESADELFARADQAMYRAKEGGRDRVEATA